MLGEIIAVGEEVLSGDVVNSNAAFISRELAELGVFSRFHVVVGDVEPDIIGHLEMAYKRSQVIVLCGGLGPTKDDLTKETLAKFLNKPLFMDEDIRKGIKEWFDTRNRQPSENNYKQALMIEGCKSLYNANGTAPGVYYEVDGRHIFLLPGPPNELIPMFHDMVRPMIEPLVDRCIRSVTMKMVNIGESQAVTLLDDLMEASDDFIVAPYAKLMEVHFKITAVDKSEAACEARIRPVQKEIHNRLRDHIYTEDSRELIQVILDEMNKKSWTLATAESCTGGLIADTIVSIPGSSRVFMEGAVTYSNEAKTRALGVDKSLLDSYGAVSEQVAEAMVKGLLERTGCTCGISVTGVAGPGGGSDEKPVGLVYIAVASPKGCKVYEQRFIGNRSRVRNQAAKMALVHLWEHLK